MKNNEKNDGNNDGNTAPDIEQNQTSSNSEKPMQWRPTKWTKEYLDQQKEEITNFEPKEDNSVTKTRIVIMGPVGVGKSSFCNTIDSIFRGRIAQQASCGSLKNSLTTNYTTYKIKNQNGTDMGFCLCDTRGMDELRCLCPDEYRTLFGNDDQTYTKYGKKIQACTYTTIGRCLCETCDMQEQCLHPDDYKYLLDGNIKNHYKFSPDYPISRHDPYFVYNPSANDRVHCIAFVFDATTVDILSIYLVANVKSFQKLAREKAIAQVVLLTNIDKLCNDVRKDTSLACTSPVVLECVENVATLFGLPRNNVFPIRNYESETELDDCMSILALIALKKMLDFSEDATKVRLEKAKLEAEHAQRWPFTWIKSQCIIL